MLVFQLTEMQMRKKAVKYKYSKLYQQLFRA